MGTAKETVKALPEPEVTGVPPRVNEAAGGGAKAGDAGMTTNPANRRTGASPSTTTELSVEPKKAPQFPW